jgi:hypothetical protein
MLQEACLTKQVGISEPAHDLNTDHDLQNLTTYFRRPRYVEQFDMPTVRTYMYGKVITPDLIFNTWFPKGFDRLLGAYGVRFTMVFHLQVAATPFHQGLVCMSFQHGQTLGLLNGVYRRGSETPTSTNIPHVRLDINNSTMACLRVPFLCTEEFVRVSAAETSSTILGELCVNSLTDAPLGTGATAPTLKLMCHLEDMEFFGASPQEVREVILQSALNKEFKTDAYPMSSALAAASESMGFVGKAVPSLAALTGTLGWAAKASAGALRSFGFSKPLIQDPPMKMVMYDSICENNTDKPQAGIMLATTSENRVAIDATLGGSNIDQMALSYVLAQPSQISMFNLTVDQINTMVWGTQVSPQNMAFRAGKSSGFIDNANPSNSANCKILGNLGYFGGMFRLWRGSITYRFTFVKTKYHAGRVLITYTPGVKFSQQLSVQTPDINKGPPQPFGLSAIVDLKDDNVVEFVVPYSAPTPFLPFNYSMGDLSVVVIDHLTHPSTTANSVSVLVEAFSTDMQLSCPNAPLYAPMPAGGTVTFQSGLSNVFNDKVDESTAGERITSLKQLIQLPHFTLANAFSTVYTAYMLPWWYQPTQYTSAPVAPPAPESFSFGGTIASCYAYVRGSTDIHVYSSGTNGNPSSEARIIEQVPWSYGNSSTSSYRSAASSNKVVSNKSGASHVRMPNYGMLSRYDPSCYNVALGNTGWSLKGNVTIQGKVYTPTPTISILSTTKDLYRSVPPNIARIIVTSSDVEAITLRIGRNAGDDAYASHFIGPPPVLYMSANSPFWDRDWPLANDQSIPPLPAEDFAFEERLCSPFESFNLLSSSTTIRKTQS